MGGVYTQQLESSIRDMCLLSPAGLPLGLSDRESMEPEGNTLFFGVRPFRCMNVFLSHLPRQVAVLNPSFRLPCLLMQSQLAGAPPSV